MYTYIQISDQITQSLNIQSIKLNILFLTCLRKTAFIPYAAPPPIYFSHQLNNDLATTIQSRFTPFLYLTLNIASKLAILLSRQKKYYYLFTKLMILNKQKVFFAEQCK